MTPAATAALSPVSATRRTTPEPRRDLCSSIRPRRSLPETPVRVWARKGTPGDGLGTLGLGRAAGHREAAAEVGDLVGLRLALVEEGADALGELLGTGPEQPGGLGQRRALGGDMGQGAFAGQRLDPAHAARPRRPRRPAGRRRCRRCARRGCRRRARASRCRRPAPTPLPARLPIETTRTSSPYFSPKSALAPSFCASSGVMIRVSTGGVLPDVGVDLGLDCRELLRGHRLAMGEVEAQPVGRDEAAALGDVVAEGPAQRLVQQVGRRVVGADRAPPPVVDGQLRSRAAGERHLPRRGPGGRRGRPSCGRR